VEFNIADKKQDYYCFNKDILSLNHDLYIHENINLEGRIFVAVRSISIFKKIDNHQRQALALIFPRYFRILILQFWSTRIEYYFLSC
jgi:hypothetical protein